MFGLCLLPVLLSYTDGIFPTFEWCFSGWSFLNGRVYLSSSSFYTDWSCDWSLLTCCLRSSTLFATVLAILRLCWTFFIDAPDFACLRASLVRAWWVSSSFLISSFLSSIFESFLWLSASFSSSSLSAGYSCFSRLSIGFALPWAFGAAADVVASPPSLPSITASAWA